MGQDTWVGAETWSLHQEAGLVKTLAVTSPPLLLSLKERSDSPFYPPLHTVHVKEHEFMELRILSSLYSNSAHTHTHIGFILGPCTLNLIRDHFYKILI